LIQTPIEGWPEPLKRSFTLQGSVVMSHDIFCKLEIETARRFRFDNVSARHRVIPFRADPVYTDPPTT
jgi:hypothetical protein